MRSGGLDICFKCMNGGAAQAVQDRGWQLSYSESKHSTNGDSHYRVKAEGKLDTEIPFEVAVRPKTGILKVLGLFWGIKMPDPLFNQMVYATSSSGAAGANFLGDDGVQSAVMDLLGEQIDITIQSDGIHVHGQRKHDPFDQSRIELEMAVLLAHTRRYLDGEDSL